MPRPKPYDRTTPPSTPRIDNHSQTAPPLPGFQTPRHRIDPRDARPAIWPYDHPTPREFRPQDDLYNAFAQDAYLSSSTETPRQTVNNPSTSGSQTLELWIRPPLVRKRGLKFTPLNLDRGSLRLTNAFTTMGQRQLMSPRTASGPPTEPAPIFKISTAAKATGWVANVRKKRHPSEIFNKNFSFSAASRRPQADHIPPISPRSSFSSGSNSTDCSIEDSFKRQRIDSSSSDSSMGFPFGRPTAETSSRGRDLGSLAMSSRDSPILSRATTAPFPRPSVAAEVHPGQLVDFSSPEYDVDLPVPSPLSEYKLWMGSEAYHDYLATTRRRKSFPIGDRATRRVRDESKMLARLDKFHAEDNSAMAGNDATESERGYMLERKVHTDCASSMICSSCSSATSPTGSSTRTTSTSVSTQASGGLRRTASDPSTEAFLAHIRASLEARKLAAAKWQDYPVFADEIEKGFLDDEPL